MRLVFVAGIGNSADHWQRHWHRHNPNSIWVEHQSWDEPVCEQWLEEFERSLNDTDEPKLIVAHSLGCLLTALWAAERYDSSVSGAFLVAAPDPCGSHFPSEAIGFGTVPAVQMPMETMVVASDNDPYSSIEFAVAIAAVWRAKFVSVGHQGHINLASGLGDWGEGWSLLCSMKAIRKLGSM